MNDASDPSQHAGPRIGRGQILLVEDNALVARTLAAILEDAGYTIRCFADGESAWEFLESDTSRDLQAMICDLGLPGISGRELMRRTAAHRPSIPIVVVSGYSEPQLHRELLANGAHSVVVKPIDSLELVAAIRAAVGP